MIGETIDTYSKEIFWILGLLIGALFVKYLINKGLVNKIGKKHLNRQEALIITKFTDWTIWILFILGLVLIFKGDLGEFWVGIAGVLGLVAIGFIAVWSMLSNILAGIIILLLKEIRIGDLIEIHGENITGKIDNVTLFYVIIVDKKNGIYNIPNNLFIQKIIRKIPESENKLIKD